ncbi:MAG TPA: LamG-like jellyroll fold domain-containing protein [Verrucomicrobiae bacterium]|nr:LamG-like jellyroll fold domain-containing protein [Verrucomicrobiae bacterium]
MSASPSVVGLWRFNEGGGTTVLDSSGLGNNGALAGENGNVPAWVAGQVGFGGALRFTNNGVDHAYVNIPAANSLTVGQTATNPWTITLWAYEDSNGTGDFVSSYGVLFGLNDSAVFSLGSGATDDAEMYTWSENNTAWQLGWGTDSTVTPLLDQWVHWAVVYDGTNLTVYRNANQGGEGGVASMPVTSPLAIPGYTGAIVIGSELDADGTANWNGMLDDVAIFSGALTQSQIATVMAGNFSSFIGGPANVVSQPRSQQVKQGSEVTFSVGAGGQSPFQYQWYFNGNKISSDDNPTATNATLVLNSVQVNQSGNYSVTVSNALGNATSEATLSVFSQSLVGLWRFDEGGGNTAIDSSGLGNNGTLLGQNGNVPARVAGQPGFGGALYLTNAGANHACITIPRTDSLTIGQTATNPWTITAWAYEDSDGTGDFISSYGRLMVIDDGLTLQFESGSSGDAQMYAWTDLDPAWEIGFGTDSGVEPLFDQWVHWALVYDGTNLTLYRDGNQGAQGGMVSAPVTEALPYTSYTGDVIIGAELDRDLANWNGMLDDVAVFNVALSQSQVQTVMSGDFSAFTAGLPAINGQPQSQTARKNSSTSLSVSVSGPGPIQYQWYFNGEKISSADNSSATNATLVLSNLQYAQSGNYSVTVSNPTGSLSSLSAALTVLPAVGTPLADYEAAVTGTPGLISYYTFDQGNANDLLGLHNGTGVNPVFAPGIGDGQGFLCNGSARVNFGAVSDFEFPSSSGTIEAWVRADWSGIHSAYEPTLWADGNGFSSEYSVHMAGDKSGIGIWNGIGYDVLPIPFAGTNWHHLVTVFDDGTFTVYWDGKLASTEFKVLGLGAYQFELGDSSPGGGEGWIGMLDEVAIYSTALDSNTVAAHYQAFLANSLPNIVAQPRGGTFLPGVSLTLSVSATGGNLTYQWFKGTQSLNGETNATLNFPNLSPGDVNTYHVVVSNSAGDVTSDEVTVALGTLPSEETRYQTAISSEAGLISYYTFDNLTANDVFGPNNGSLQGSATFASSVAGGANQGLLLDGSGQVNFGNVADFAFNSGSGSIEAWVRADWPDTFTSYSPTLFANRDSNNGLTEWSVNITANKQVLAIYNGSRSVLFAIPNGGAGTNWHHVAVAFDQGSNTVYWDGEALYPGTLNQVFGPNPGTTQLGSSSPDSTTEGWIGMLDDVAFYSSALSAEQIQSHYDAFYQGDVPVISVQPIGGNFLAGTPFTMSAQAQGAQLTYQWYKDGVPIPGATTLTLSSPALDLTNSGVYYVTASNSVGVVRSDNAVVSVGNDVARYQATVLNESSLISYYTFDAGDATDSHGAHNGTAMGGVSFTNGPGGVTNLALALDGSGQIDLGQVSAFDFVSGGTAEAWIKPAWDTSVPPGFSPCVFSDRNGGSVWSVHMTALQNAIGNWNNANFVSLPVSNTSGWHHFAITFGDGEVSIYWDGQLVGTFDQAINIFSGETTQIGASDPNFPQEGWTGDIDEVAFYGSALSADDINNHFLAMVGPELSPTISYSVSGNQITLSWPNDVSGFTLESTASLTSPVWTLVSGVVNNSVTLTISPGNQFFRLRK